MNQGHAKPLTILKELKEFIIPLSEEEFSQLERNVIEDGCREALIVWPQKGGHLVLVDGHNRYKICQKNNIGFAIKSKAFKDFDEVKSWMVANQMGRRNLSPDQMSYYRGLQYLATKKKKGGYDNVKLKGQNDISTSELIAEQHKVSESTIKRDAKFAMGLELIGRSNPKLKLNILMGKSVVKKTDVQILADDPNQKLQIKNEADLHNKVKIIREELQHGKGDRMKVGNAASLDIGQVQMDDYEPLFLPQEENLKKQKARIVSAINRAINERSPDAIAALTKLVEKFSNDLMR